MFSNNALLSTIGALVFGSGAFAHSPYLLPNEFDVSSRDHVSVQASFTEKFFVPDIVMKATAWHVVGPDGASTPLTPVYTKDVAILDVDTLAAGTYRISTGVRDGRVAKATIENGEWKFVREGAALPANVRMYDTKSITLAEMYVSRGAPSDQALAPRNKGLEFQMLTHPRFVLPGDAPQAESHTYAVTLDVGE